MQFKDVVGQNELKFHLVKDVDHDKISHAQLFLGKAGHGGLPLALAYVQYIFCQNKIEQDSCGVCPSCRKVSDLQHPDLHFSFPVVQANGKKSDLFIKEWRQQLKENPYFDLSTWTEKIDDKGRKPIISVEEGQEIIKKLSLKSFEGGYKIVIIWMAEEMNTIASNKLLKILEEPPARTLFLLLADSQESLLQTILSRTQTVQIPRISNTNLVQYIQNKHQLDISAATSLTSLAEGDLIEVENLLSLSHDKDSNRDLFIQLMRVCFKKDVLAMMDWADNAGGIGKEKQKMFLRYALHMFRQSLLKNYGTTQLSRTSKEEEDFLKNFAKFITGNNITGFVETFNDAHYHIDRNAHAKILFTELTFKVMRYIHFA
jgi:DNA polymerase-3 subunit delta'